MAKKSGVKAGGRKSDMAKAVMGKLKSGALIWDGTQFELAQEDPGESSNSIAEAKVAPMVVANDIVENVVLEDFPHFVGAPYLNEERGRSRERRGISARNFRGNSSKRVRSVSSSGYSGSSTDPEKRNMPSSGKNTGKRGKGQRKRLRGTEERTRKSTRHRSRSTNRHARRTDRREASTSSEGSESSEEDSGSSGRDESHSIKVREYERRMERLERAEREAGVLEGIEQKGLRSSLAASRTCGDIMDA